MAAQRDAPQAGARIGQRTDSAADAPSVLLADGPNRAQRFRSWLEPDFDVSIGVSHSAASAAVGDGVDVAILGAGVSEETKQRLLEVLDLRAPFARSIVVPDDDQPPMLEAPGYDVCLFEPVSRDQLEEATRRLARIAIYERTVATYFEYTTHAASLEVAAGENAVAEEDHAAILDEIHALQERLAVMRDALDEADRAILLDSLESDPGATVDGEVRKSEDKRQPDVCSECGLDWRVDHGGDLEYGCDKLGAFVWKCRRCGTVQQAADPSHQWIA